MDIELAHAVWIGLAATLVMTVVLYALPVIGFPKTDVAFFLGTFLRVPHSRAALYGLGIHFAMGVVFAFLYGLGFLFLDVEPKWWIGSIGGVIHWFTVMMSMDVFSEVNREVRAGRLRNPGMFLSNLGIAAAIGSLVRHITFGTMVGLLYDIYATS